SSTFPALGGTATGWSHTAPGTVSSPTGGPYNSGASPNNFSWSAGTSSSPTEAIVGSDNGGNTATTALTFTNDTSATAPAITFPANNAHYNSGGWATISGTGPDPGSGRASAPGWPGSISGTAADSSSSVATVKLSIQKDGGANSCWDGTNAAGHFTSACPNYVTATGTTSWSANLGSSALIDGSSYAITVETIDNATNANTNTSAATATYVYDTTAPNTAALTTNGNYSGAGFPANLTGTTTHPGTGR